MDKAKVGPASLSAAGLGFVTCLIASVSAASVPPSEGDVEVDELGMTHTAGFFVLSSTGLMVLIFFSGDMLMVITVIYCLAVRSNNPPLPSFIF